MLHHPYTILLYGDIDERACKMFTEKMLHFSKARNLLIRINSYGGDMLCALSIINVMSQHKGTVITIVDGFAASAASLIAVSAPCRFMFKDSYQLTHSVVNDDNLNADTFNMVIRSIYNNVDLPENKWLTSRECFEFGLCDKII